MGSLGQENVFHDILERKNAFICYKNKEFKKMKNWDFSKGVSPWFWSKIGHFSIFFFWGNLGHENAFYDILERKNAFLGYKNKNLRKSKNWVFFKGLVHRLGLKLAIFPFFFCLGNLGQENGFYDILEGKNAFVFFKNKELKKSKNWLFSKGVSPWFWSEIAFFFFKAIWLRKMCFMIF